VLEALPEKTIKMTTLTNKAKITRASSFFKIRYNAAAFI
jgi:hypothetical protein